MRTLCARTKGRGLRSRLLILALGTVIGSGGLLSLTGCRATPTNVPLAEEAARAKAVALHEHLERHPGDRDVRRELGFLHWMHLGASDDAVTVLSPLVGTETADPAALYALAEIAHSRMQPETVWAHAKRLLALATIDEPTNRRGESSRALAQALSEPVMRLVDDIHGERIGDDAQFVTFYDSLPISRLPVDSARTLTSLRARIARRRGEDYLGFYDRQGCVRSWSVGVVEGRLGAMELSLREAAGTSFVEDSDAEATALSCAVRLWNPSPRSGIRRLRSTLDVAGEVIALQLSSQHPMRAYIDGLQVYASDGVDRWPLRNATVQIAVEPGPHLLEVRTVIPNERSWMLVRATDLQGKALPAHSGGDEQPSALSPAAVQPLRALWPDLDSRFGDQLHGSTYVQLRHHLALEDALAEGDSDRAERLAAALAPIAGQFAEAQLLLGEFEDADPSRGRGASRTRQRRFVQRALELSPAMDRSRLQLLAMDFEREEVADVIRSLQNLPGGVLDHVAGNLFRWRVYRDRGNEYLAEEALLRAAELHPQNCDVLLAQRRVARDREQVDREDSITQKLSHCAGTLGLRARWALRRGETSEARALWREQLKRVPDDIEAMDSLAHIATLEDEPETAIRLYERILSLAPYHSNARVAIADTYAQRGDTEGARTAVREALAHFPHNSRLREIAETVGLEDPLMSWREDGKIILDRYRGLSGSKARIYEGVGEVMVLDRDVAQIYPDGSQRHLVHQMIHMMSKESLDRHGEYAPPEGAKLLTLHTIKPDGRIVEPESIAGKSGLSLRELAPGDVLEFEYVMEQGPTELLSGYVDLGRFSFQSLDVPFHHSELTVLHPPEMSKDLLVELRNGAPPAERSRVAGSAVIRFSVDHRPRLGAEPSTRSMLDEIPMVRVHRSLSATNWVNSIAATLRPAQRSNPELRTLVKDLLDGVEDRRERLSVLWNWCIDNVEDAGDMSLPATRTLASRHGNRLMLLRAMLRVAKIDSELWLARDAFGPSRPPSGERLFESYGAPMLAVRLDGKDRDPIMVLTSSRVLPLGYLTPGFAGSEALRVQLADDDPPAGPVQLPGVPPGLEDERSYDLKLTLGEGGEGRLEGTITLQGLEAMQWRGALEQVDHDRVEEVFQQAELSRILAGAGLDLESLEIDNEDALQRPLVLRFKARASRVGVTQGGELVLPSALVSLNQGMTYSVLPKRWSGLLVGYAPTLRVRATVDLVGLRFSSLPPPRSVEGPFGSYVRTMVEGAVDGSKITLESRSTLMPGTILPEDYVAFKAFTALLQEHERSVFRAR